MTVWYFDAEERAEAKKKFRNLTGMIFFHKSIENNNSRHFCFTMATQHAPCCDVTDTTELHGTTQLA